MVNLRLPWLQEQYSQGNIETQERILDALVVVKLFLTLKHVINVNSQKSFTGLWSDARASLSLFFFFFLALDCWCLFTGIFVHQLWSFVFSCKHEVGAGMSADAGIFFLSHCDGAPLGVGALRNLHTLRIVYIYIRYYYCFNYSFK